MKYLTVEDPSKVFYLDCETDSLAPTKIHCVVIKNKQSQQIWRFSNDRNDNVAFYNSLRDWFLEHGDAILVGHNIVSFDSYWLSYFIGISWDYSRTVDSLILSYLYNPGLEGGHSLEVYGERLKFPKVVHEDWSTYSPEMLHRCEMDVELTEKVHDALLKKMNSIGFSELSCQIEHEIRVVIDEQERNGFYFKRAEAESFRGFLRDQEVKLAGPIQDLFPAELKEVKTFKEKYKKDGELRQSYLNHLEIYDRIQEHEDSSYTCFTLEEFNIASPKQRLERLLGLGYEPTAKTKKGNPRIDEDSLVAYAKLSGKPEISMMAEWLVCNGRANMIHTWLKYVQGDSRIHGKVLTCAANSRRFIHNNPNTANIPSPKKAKYGKEVRAFWAASPGKVLVGYDASSLETVGLLHYLNNPEAAKALTQPKPNDIHTMNARSLSEALGRPVDREWGSKTSWYAWLYGAYPKKLGEIVKGSTQDGETAIKTFYKNVPGLKQLTIRVQKEWHSNNGLLRCIDGGFVRCHSMNAALNYKVQSLGAIVMKMAAILLREEGIKLGLNFKLVGSIHDEGQLECDEKDAKDIGHLAVSCITQAAKLLGVRETLTGEYHIGENWSETH